MPLNICVVGLGGGGCEIVSQYMANRVKQRKGKDKSVTVIAVNMDEVSLKDLHHRIHEKIPIGEGIGAGMDPKQGADAFQRKQETIMKGIGDPECCIIVATLGGGTGTGCLPELLKVLRRDKPDIFVVSIVTLPILDEGDDQYDNTKRAFEKHRIVENSDMMIVESNEKALELCTRLNPDVDMEESFKVIDRRLPKVIDAFIDLVQTGGFLNIDFADVKAKMKGTGLGHIGRGVDGDLLRALQKARTDGFSGIVLEGAKSALVNISGRSKAGEVRAIFTEFADKHKINHKRYGFRFRRKGKMEVSLIVGGVKSRILDEFLKLK